VKNKKWARNPIDTFILARLENQKLSPSPEADRVTLIRRLSLDLIGLPPTIDEVDRFVADKSPDAYEKVVERLLASPHYGERWDATGSMPPVTRIAMATKRTRPQHLAISRLRHQRLHRDLPSTSSRWNN